MWLKVKRKQRLEFIVPVQMRIGTIPEEGTGDDFKRIMLDLFDESSRYQHSGPKMKFEVVVDVRGCAVASSNRPPRWTVDDLGKRMPGMYGSTRRRYTPRILYGQFKNALLE